LERDMMDKKKVAEILLRMIQTCEAIKDEAEDMRDEIAKLEKEVMSA